MPKNKPKPQSSRWLIMLLVVLLLGFIALSAYLFTATNKPAETYLVQPETDQPALLASFAGKTSDAVRLEYGEPTRAVTNPNSSRDLWVYEGVPEPERVTYVYIDNGVVYDVREVPENEPSDAEPTAQNEPESETQRAQEPTEEPAPEEEDSQTQPSDQNEDSDLPSEPSDEPEDEEESEEDTKPPLVDLTDLLNREKDRREGLGNIIATFTPKPSIFDSINPNALSKLSQLGTSIKDLGLRVGVVAEPRVFAIILEKIEVLDDTDPMLNGELQVITAVRTGNITQKTSSPHTLWYEVDGGDHVKINKPIFMLPKDQLGDKITLSILAYDNDDLPANPAGILSDYLDVQAFMADLAGYDDVASAANWADSQQNRFFNWLGGDEKIGHQVNILKKNNNYGLGSTDHERTLVKRNGNAIFTYRILESKIPKKPIKVQVILKDYDGVGDSGDIGNDGELWIDSFVSDGFDHLGNMAGRSNRFPTSGTFDRGDGGDWWNLDRVIFEATTQSPLLYIESGIWDDDGVTSNPEQVGIWRRTLGIGTKGTTWTSPIMKGTANEYGKDASGRAYIQVKIRPAE